MQHKRALVIGSGVAGLAVAIRLRLQGFEVAVYEKNNAAGGKISAFEKAGFRFDAGPSLFTQPQLIEELFLLANEPIQHYFTYQPVAIACQYFYENGKVVHAYTDAGAFARELHQKLNEKPAAVHSYLRRSANLYQSIGSIFLNSSLHKATTWLHASVLKALTVLKPSYLFQSLHQYNTHHFASEEAAQLFNRFATYNGSSPYKAPAMLSLIPHLEMNLGTYYPTGGMISIPQALYALAKKTGVQFYFNKAVQQIIVDDKKAKGIVVNNQSIAADVVVSTMDVYFTYKNLLNDCGKATQILQQERSSSAIVFYWGINTLFPQLQLHNVFFSSDYQKEFDCIFNQKNIYNDPTVYVNISAKIEKENAPTGMENWFVMVNVPANVGQDWAMLQQQLRQHVITKLSRMLGQDIEACIVSETNLDPIKIEAQTAAYSGALYGASSNNKWSAFLRPANFTTGTRGLYFCGGTVHPGGGIPLCLQSAKIASNLIATNCTK